MYAHNIQSLGEISRLFDVLLAREPVFTFYLFVAIIRSRRDELLRTRPTTPTCCTPSSPGLPTPLNLEALIRSAADLERAHPPASLPSWSRVSRFSVLKTALLLPEPPEDGQWYFDQHVAEIERAKKRQERIRQARAVVQRLRRPAQRALGVARPDRRGCHPTPPASMGPVGILARYLNGSSRAASFMHRVLV